MGKMTKNKKACANINNGLEEILKAVGVRSVKQEKNNKNNNTVLPNDFFDFLQTSSFRYLSINDRELIAKELKRRKITELIHFTSKSNLNSIKKLGGILSRKQLSERSDTHYSFTDENRFDGELNGISVSITRPNYFMLRQKIENGQIKEPYIITIKAELLLNPNMRFVFYDGNASSPDKNKGSTYKDFLRMFQNDKPVIFTSKDGTLQSKTREELFRKENETTDGQAEILVEGIIPFEYITSAYKFDLEGEEDE